MAGSDFGAVKLISLDILEFKNLLRGKISWEYDIETKFGVVNIQPYDEHTTIYEAIQFGFGHDTNDDKAAVTVTLQRSNQDEHQIHHFSHLKSARFGHQFKIKVEGIHNEYQLIDQDQYFERLSELHIFALTQTFMFGNACKDTLADNDLRRFLEMHLMNKRTQNNYDELQSTLETLYEQKKTFQQVLRLLNNRTKDFNDATKMQSKKTEAENAEQDLHLLHLFYHHKTIEMMREQVENARNLLSRTPNVQKDHLSGQIYDWTEKMDQNHLMQLAQSIDGKMNRVVLNAMSKQNHKNVDLIEEELKALNIATHASIDRFSKLYFRNEYKLHEYWLACDQAKFKLREAKLLGRIATFEQKMQSERGREIPFDEKVAGDFLGIPSNNGDRLAAHLKTIQEEIQKDIGGDGIESKSKVFKILGDQCLGGIRKIVDTMPATGHSVVETDTKVTAERLRTLLSDDSIRGARTVTHNYRPPRPSDTIRVGNVVIKRITGTKTGGLPSFPVDAAQKTVQDRIEMEREMLALIEKFKNHRCAVIKKDTSTKNDALINEQQLIQLEQEVFKAEEKLAAQYLKVFGDILMELGFRNFNEGTMDPKEIVYAVDLCKKYQNVFKLSGQNPHPLIETAQKNLSDLKNERLSIDEQIRNHEARFGTDASLLFDDLLNEGKSIADQVSNYLTRTSGEMVILLAEAAVESKLLLVDYLTVKTRKLNLPSNTSTRLTQAYFDCIAEENRPDIDPNEQSMSKIREAVSAKISKIEDMLCSLDRKDEYLHYDVTNTKKHFQKEQTKMNNQMVNERNKFRNRNEAFKTHFDEFLANFDSFSEYCQQKWGMLLRLCYDEQLLLHPIRMIVEDPLLDDAHGQGTILNHYAAALVVQLAINKTIRSPILIIDSLDYMIEPKLISPIKELLMKMIADMGIQVLFMQLKPQEKMIANSSHHSWIETDEERLAGTTDLVMIQEPLDTSLSQLSIQSASSGRSN